MPDDREPTRIGRYTIIRKIGSGGMGEVYAAFDEQLDRKVALKVLRPEQSGSGEGNVRLLREAQAMARLAHPNVVAIHEVSEHGSGLFLAMEFVAGVTLDAWLAASPRGWREIVAAFVAAGRGVQAAHEAGVIHRDLKPSNVMVGDDGRVRVLDFGIAAPRWSEQATGEEPQGADPTTISSSAFSWKLTLDGTVLGTPTYMSPEQYLGQPLTPASDQFSLAVALYEALYGLHPFVGEPFTFTELRARVVTGKIRETSPSRARGVPGWIDAVLRRALRAAPADRYRSVGELLKALDRDPSRLRRRILAPIGLAVAAAIGGFGVSAAVKRDPIACDGGEAVMAGLWGPARGQELRAAFRGTGLSFGDAVLASVVRGLDEYTRGWAAMHRDACVAHRDGEQSGALLDQRMSCLDRRRHALAGALGLLAAPDPAVVEGAVRLVNDLPPIAACGDRAGLGAAPPEPAVAAAIEAQLRRLDEVRSLAAVGRAGPAIDLARDVIVQARALRYRPLEAEALLAEGRTLLTFDADRGEVLRALSDATLAAIDAGLLAEAAEALARRAYVIALMGRETSEALFDAELARAYLHRIDDPPALLGLLTNNIGAIYVAAGDHERASERFAEALEIMERLADDDPIERSQVLANAAMQLDEGERRRELFDEMVALRRERLGEGHPLTAHGVILQALFTVDPDLAAERFARGCEAFDAAPGDHAGHRMQCRLYLAHALAEAGERERAATTFRGALDLAGPELAANPEAARALAIERGYAALYAGESASIVDLLRGELGRADPEGPWWSRLERAEVGLALALNLLAVDRADEAAPLLDDAIAALGPLTRQVRDVAVHQRLAAARVARARALIERGGLGGAPLDRARVTEDLDLAALWYREGGPGYRWRLDEIDRLRRAGEL